MERYTFVMIVLIFVIVIVISFFVYLGFKTIKEINEQSRANQSQVNESITVLNGTEGTKNETAGTENESEGKNAEIPSRITGIDLREDNGGYFCDNSTSPVHKVRLYTYKTINKVKVLSDKYVESNELKNVCDNYPDVNETKSGMRYNIRWQWDSVEGISGYRIYQYYYATGYNITRNYDYYVEVSSSAVTLLDEGLELWTEEK